MKSLGPQIIFGFVLASNIIATEATDRIGISLKLKLSPTRNKVRKIEFYVEKDLDRIRALVIKRFRQVVQQSSETQS